VSSTLYVRKGESVAIIQAPNVALATKPARRAFSPLITFKLHS
jgi:hypothetical protein